MVGAGGGGDGDRGSGRGGRTDLCDTLRHGDAVGGCFGRVGNDGVGVVKMWVRREALVPCDVCDETEELRAWSWRGSFAEVVGANEVSWEKANLVFGTEDEINTRRR